MNLPKVETVPETARHYDLIRQQIGKRVGDAKASMKHPEGQSQG